MLGMVRISPSPTWKSYNSNFSRDVAAGFAILEEAGGLVTTANPPSDIETAEITRAHLGGRLYLAIRQVVHTSRSIIN